MKNYPSRTYDEYYEANRERYRERSLKQKIKLVFEN
jgi:hypothetical protein